MKSAALTFCLLLATNHVAAREVISLDGTWTIIFDRRNEGRERQWQLAEKFSVYSGKRAIQVPSCWEESEKDYEGIAYYRRIFTIPDDWEGKFIRLHFGAVNFSTEIWLNDQAVGFHEGGFTPFEFRVDEAIKYGQENQLILRVSGPILMTNKRIDGVGKMETPQWRGAIAGGIWQPVTMSASGEIYVKDVFIETKISDNTAAFHLQLEHNGVHGTPAEVKIGIREQRQSGQVVAGIQKSVQLDPGNNRKCLSLEIPDAAYWSPESPTLYRADVTVTHHGSVADRWTTRFGMREFTIRDNRFYLNGKPVYLKATFFEGLYPVKLAYPDSRDMVVREIGLAKAAGFNMIRPWRKPPPPIWLDVAEEMGVLTVGSLAIECMDFPVETARLPGWVENEVRQSILRDRNRASVVQWELFNELKRPVLKQLLHPMAMLARELDPTRLILDESGGWAHGANMYLPYQSTPTPLNDIHNYPGPQIQADVFDGFLIIGKTDQEQRAMGIDVKMPGRNVRPDRMSFVSELGYGSLPDLVDNNRRFAAIGNPIVPPTVYHRRLAEDHVQVLKESGFDQIYPDLRQFCLDQQRIHGIANRRMIEAVRCNPDIQGYCIHALTAGDWIIGAGLLDLFRNPKTYAYEGTKAANQPRIISIRVRPRNVYAERGTKIDITGVNELESVQGTLSVKVIASDGTVVLSKQAHVDMATGVTPLFTYSLATSSLQGTYEVQATITALGGARITQNARRFEVFATSQLAVPQNRVAILDSSNWLKWFFRKSNVQFVEFDQTTDISLPVFVPRTAAATAKERRQFAQLIEFVKKGGTAVYLQGVPPGVIHWSRSPKLELPLLPVSLRVKVARGLWTCVPHIVKDHPVFDGLPTNCMMGSVYENVWARETLIDVGGETIVGAIGFDWFPEFDDFRRHYYGPGDTWWGADMAVVPCGQGRLIISQLRLQGNLDKDPVADKILYNLIRYTTRGATTQHP